MRIAYWCSPGIACHYRVLVQESTLTVPKRAIVDMLGEDFDTQAEAVTTLEVSEFIEVK